MQDGLELRCIWKKAIIDKKAFWIGNRSLMQNGKASMHFTLGGKRSSTWMGKICATFCHFGSKLMLIQTYPNWFILEWHIYTVQTTKLKLLTNSNDAFWHAIYIACANLLCKDGSSFMNSVDWRKEHWRMIEDRI